MKPPTKKSDKQKRAKADLLRDLESLRAQLAESATLAVEDDEIPLLLDEVEHVIAEEKDGANQGAAATRSAAKVLPGQQSLFEKTRPEEADTAAPPAKSAALGDNPFLPKHIRDRLDERRRALAENVSQAERAFASTPKSDAPAETASLSPAAQTLIDELVADYLPRIEAELRWRLVRQMKQRNEPNSGTDEPD